MRYCRADALFALGSDQDTDPADPAPLPAPVADGLTPDELVSHVIGLLDHFESASRTWDGLPDNDAPQVLAETAAFEDLMDAAEDGLLGMGFASVEDAEDWLARRFNDEQADAEVRF